MKVSREKVVKHIMLYMVVIALSILPIGHSVFAKAKPTKGVDANGNTWKYDKKTKTLTFKGTKDLQENLLDGHSRAPEWFCWDEEVEHLVIKEGITGLPGGTFYFFTELKTVVLPDTVTHIGVCVFDSCMSLEQIQMSKNIVRIGDYAFDGCTNLKEIQIPEKVQSIGRGAFGGCENLKEVLIPNNVKEIGFEAFGDCLKLKKIKLPKKLKVISEYLFYNCKNLKTVTIPDSVTTIYAGAFHESGIEQIVIPKNVKYIKKGEWCEGIFLGCKNLKSIVIKSKKIESCFKSTFEGVNDNVVIEVPKCMLKKYKAMFQKNGLSKKVKIKGIS